MGWTWSGMSREMDREQDGQGAGWTGSRMDKEWEG